MPVGKIIKKILKRITKGKDKKLSISDLSYDELIKVRAVMRDDLKARREMQELYEGGRKGSLREIPAVDETSRFAELTDTPQAKGILKSTNGFSVRSRNPRGNGYKAK